MSRGTNRRRPRDKQPDLSGLDGSGLDEPVRGIGPAAEWLGVHPRTLMAYERIGLVRPKRRSNRRLYSDQDLARLECVQDLNHSAGISLHGLAVLAQFVPCWAVRQEVESGRAPSPGQALEAGLDRVLGAFGGEAPGRCRKCGVYQARRGHAKDALDRVSSAQR